MNPRRHVSGDDVCLIVHPDGPPPGCPKLNCHATYLHFARDIGPEEKLPLISASGGGQAATFPPKRGNGRRKKIVA